MCIRDRLQTYAGRGSDLEPWLRDAEINRDRSLRLQYLAGLALDFQDAYNIYATIVGYRRYPRDVFLVSPADEARLHAFVDGQLSPEDRVAVLEQLGTDPAAAARVAQWQAQRQACLLYTSDAADE